MCIEFAGLLEKLAIKKVIRMEDKMADEINVTEAKHILREGVLSIPCWLCGYPVKVKFTKKDKPFLVCNNCGLQTFIRYKKAEDLLLAKLKKQMEGKQDG